MHTPARPRAARACSTRLRAVAADAGVEADVDGEHLDVYGCREDVVGLGIELEDRFRHIPHAIEQQQQLLYYIRRCLLLLYYNL